MLDLIAASQHGSSKLAFGVLENDGFVTPHPPVQRAIGTYLDKRSLLFRTKFRSHDYMALAEKDDF